MAREFDAYHEQFVADRPNKDGKFAWLVRIYTYAKEPGLVASQKGLADSKDEARAAARASAVSHLEKYQRPPV